MLCDVNRMIKYLILAVILALGIGIIFGSSFFEINEVIIRGYDESEVKVADIRGENIFTVDFELVKDTLKTDPYIESVEVSRSFPDQVIFQVNYNRPIAAIINDGYYIVYNKYNRIIAENIEHNRYDLPVFKDTPYYFSGNNIIIPSTQVSLLNKLEILPDDLRENIKEIHFDPVGIYMIMEQGYDIRVGTAENLEDKFIVLISAWYEGMLNDDGIEYVDITAPERPVIKK